jgi:RNA polymerase sigma-70 factor (ECF subfamily)
VTENEELLLVERAIGGDASAFAEIYTLHKGKVYRLCLMMTHNHYEAEDQTQELFVHVMSRLQSFRGHSKFSTWLNRVSKNLLLMSFRKGRFEPTLTSLDEQLETGDADLYMRISRVDLALESSISRISIENAIKTIPESYQEIYRFYYVLGYKHPEIARQLGISISRSKKRLSKMKELVAEKL